ncbi:hypothetical protein ACEWY4_021064 [Coilia grayii]|uniref:Cystatin domain-containing protein n=1 Tax=Coilia grayii TaxID=363190 RepID=A0ABD1J7Z3_9TELE
MMWRAAVLLVTLAMAMVSTSVLPGGIQPMIPGAPKDVNTTTPEVREALNFAVNEFNKRNNDIYIYKVEKVNKAQIQVVFGILYIFEVQMVRSGIKNRGEMMPSDKSEVTKPYTCFLRVLSRPWLGRPQLTEHVCKR